MWGCAIVDNFMDKNYVVLVRELSSGVFFGMLPDFSLSCFEDSRELVFDKLTSMANTFIKHSRTVGNGVSAPTPDSQLADRWDGFEIGFLTLRV